MKVWKLLSESMLENKCCSFSLPSLQFSLVSAKHVQTDFPVLMDDWWAVHLHRYLPLNGLGSGHQPLMGRLLRHEQTCCKVCCVGSCFLFDLATSCSWFSIYVIMFRIWKIYICWKLYTNISLNVSNQSMIRLEMINVPPLLGSSLNSTYSVRSSLGIFVPCPSYLPLTVRFGMTTPLLRPNANSLFAFISFLFSFRAFFASLSVRCRFTYTYPAGPETQE